MSVQLSADQVRDLFACARGYVELTLKLKGSMRPYWAKIKAVKVGEKKEVVVLELKWVFRVEHVDGERQAQRTQLLPLRVLVVSDYDFRSHYDRRPGRQLLHIEVVRRRQARTETESLILCPRNSPEFRRISHLLGVRPPIPETGSD